MRVAAGVGAWLLGVGAATAGSLLAVSLLGQGIATSTSQQLTESAVQRALAAEATETAGPGPAAATGSSSPAPSAARSHQARLSQGVSQTEATPSVQPSPSPAASPPSAQTRATARATATATPSSTLLTSQGGTVVADCQAGGAYLLSWSPAPGYEVDTVRRGPALTARVIFTSTANSVTMVVSCSTGVPTATSTVGAPGGVNDSVGPTDE
jgi:lipoprotein-anchoring transpeptidase ErfK/SrfK